MLSEVQPSENWHECNSKCCCFTDSMSIHRGNSVLPLSRQIYWWDSLYWYWRDEVDVSEEMKWIFLHPGFLMKHPAFCIKHVPEEASSMCESSMVHSAACSILYQRFYMQKHGAFCIKHSSSRSIQHVNKSSIPHPEATCRSTQHSESSILL